MNGGKLVTLARKEFQTKFVALISSTQARQISGRFLSEFLKYWVVGNKRNLCTFSRAQRDMKFSTFKLVWNVSFSVCKVVSFFKGNYLKNYTWCTEKTPKYCVDNRLFGVPGHVYKPDQTTLFTRVSVLPSLHIQNKVSMEAYKRLSKGIFEVFDSFSTL